MLKVMKLTSEGIDFEQLESMLHFALDGALTDDVTVNVQVNDTLLDKLSPGEYVMQAVLYKLSLQGNYSLILRKRMDASLKEVAFHESAHLKQYEGGLLELDIKTGKCRWKGKEYDGSYPYMERPWEKEAFKEQRRLMKEWKAAQKSVKKVKKCLFKKK